MSGAATVLASAWLPVPGFPEYEVCARLKVRKARTKYEILKTGSKVRLVRDGVPQYLSVRDLWALAQDPEGQPLAQQESPQAEAEPNWLPVPLFPNYQVSAQGAVRNATTRRPLKSYGSRYALHMDRHTYYLHGEDILGMAQDPEHPKLAELRETLGLPEQGAAPEAEPEALEAEEEPLPDFLKDEWPEPSGDLVQAEADSMRARLAYEADLRSGCPWRNGSIEMDSAWDWAGILL